MSQVATWVEFRAPESEPLFEINNKSPWSKSRQKWINTICPLVEPPGFDTACWSRIRERPDTVTLCICWESREALDTFRTSPEHAVFWSGISAFATDDAPVVSLLFEDGGLTTTYFINHSKVSLLRTRFPGILDAQQRANVVSLIGLIEGFGTAPGTKHLITLPWHEVRRVWSSEAGEGDKLFLFHSWRSWEAEEEWKSTGTKYYWKERARVAERLPPEEWWDRSVRDLGAVGWGQEHFTGFQLVPQAFVGEPTMGRFIRGRKVIAGGRVVERLDQSE